jgi:hypothetical protein
VVREDAVHLDIGYGGLAGVDLVDATCLEAHEEPLERLVVFGRDRDDRVGDVPGVVAHVEPVDDIVAFVLPDVVEDARKDAGVNQVAGDLDGLALHAQDSFAVSDACFGQAASFHTSASYPWRRHLLN